VTRFELDADGPSRTIPVGWLGKVAGSTYRVELSGDGWVAMRLVSIGVKPSDPDERREHSVLRLDTERERCHVEQHQVLDRLLDETRKRDSEEKSKKDREAVVRQLVGLVANTMRSVQALEGKLTPEEQQKVFHSIERANRAHGGGSLDELRERLSEMEVAAGIISQAMLRTGPVTPRSESAD